MRLEPRIRLGLAAVTLAVLAMSALALAAPRAHAEDAPPPAGPPPPGGSWTMERVYDDVPHTPDNLLYWWATWGWDGGVVDFTASCLGVVESRPNVLWDFQWTCHDQSTHDGAKRIHVYSLEAKHGLLGVTMDPPPPPHELLDLGDENSGDPKSPPYGDTDHEIDECGPESGVHQSVVVPVRPITETEYWYALDRASSYYQGLRGTASDPYGGRTTTYNPYAR